MTNMANTDVTIILKCVWLMYYSIQIQCQDFPNNIWHISGKDVKINLQILGTGQQYSSQISSQLKVL